MHLVPGIEVGRSNEAFDRFDDGVRQVVGAQATSGIFSTYPQPFLSLAGGLVDQIVGTALLLVLVFALGDSKNFAPEGRIGPILVGAGVVLIGMSFGYNAGYAINPARDLGPRIAHAVLPIAGKGSSDWGYAWIPIVGPIVGGVMGALAYQYIWK